MLPVTALLATCADSGEDSPQGPFPPDAEVIYSTQYLDIAPLSEISVCAGTLRQVDDYIEIMRAILDVDFNRRMTVYLQMSGSSTLAEDCADWFHRPAAACYVRNGQGEFILSPLDSLAHEIVHGVTADHGSSWWNEGIARAYALPELFRRPRLTGTFRASLGDSGHLTRWLVEEYGGPAFMELFSRSSRHATQSEVEAAVQDVLGLPFDQLLRDYAAEAPDYYSDPWTCYAPPGAPTADWTAGYWEISARMDCDSPLILSDTATNGARMALHVPLEIPADGPYRFVVDHPDAAVSIMPCPRTRTPAPDPLTWPLRLSPYLSAPHLLHGPHILIVDLPVDEPSDVKIAGYPTIL